MNDKRGNNDNSRAIQKGEQGSSPFTISSSSRLDLDMLMAEEDFKKRIESVMYFPHEIYGQVILDEAGSCEIKGVRHWNISISKHAVLDVTDDIHIGAWTMIGSGTRIDTHDHYFNSLEVLQLVQRKKGVKHQPKLIGRDVWIMGARILYQVTEIPDGVVVGAGAVLTKNPGAYEIWAGNPAKKVGER